jgi:hypothetical protein
MSRGGQDSINFTEKEISPKWLGYLPSGPRYFTVVELKDHSPASIMMSQRKSGGLVHIPPLGIIKTEPPFCPRVDYQGWMRSEVAIPAIYPPF